MLSLMVCLVHSSTTLLVIVWALLTSVLTESVWTARSLREEALQHRTPITQSVYKGHTVLYTDLKASVILSISDTILYTGEPSCV